MKSKFEKIIISIMIIIPFIIGSIYYNKLPNTLPIHYNFQGIADNYANKAFVLFGIPVLMILLVFFMLYVVKRDNKAKTNNIIINITVIAILLLNILMNCYSIYYTLYSNTLNISTISSIFLGVLFIIMGNYMPKISYNYFIGIKLPWTFANEDVWNKTHRFAGFIWIICGLIICINTFFKNNNIIMISAFIAMILLPSIYSYVEYIKIKK